MTRAALVAVTLTAGMGQAAPAKPEHRAIAMGFSGSAKPQTRTALAGAVARGFMDAAGTHVRVMDCAEIYATLQGLGQDPEACAKGALTSEELSIFEPDYLMGGEAMAVGDAVYVTVRLMDHAGAVVETAQVNDTHSAKLLDMARAEMKAAAGRRLALDGLTAPVAPSPAPQHAASSAGRTVACSVVAPGGSGSSAGSAGRPLAASKPPPSPTVAVVVLERPIQTTEFVWQGPTLLAGGAVRDQLAVLGVTPVDVGPFLGEWSNRLSQDGTITKAMAQKLFGGAPYKQAYCLRLVYKDMGAQGPQREWYASLHVKVFDPPATGELKDHMEREERVTCPVADPDACRLAVLDRLVRPTLETLVRANPVP